MAIFRVSEVLLVFLRLGNVASIIFNGCRLLLKFPY